MVDYARGTGSEHPVNTAVACTRADLREAEKETSFSMREVGDGTWQGWFTLPDLEAAALRKAVMAIAAPKHQRATGDTYDHQAPSRE